MALRSPSLSPSIRGLVRHLLSPQRENVQRARAQLMIEGGRAVEALVGALEGGNDRLKLQAIPILGLIRDARAREPLIALLMDREAKIRVASVRALARFPSRETIVNLEKVVKDEARADVRIAAVQSLAAIFDEGHEEALRELLGILFDPVESRSVRLTAFAVLPSLSFRERRAILKKLRGDPDSEVALRARNFSEDTGRINGEEGVGDIEPPRLAAQLASRSHAKWNEAMHGLINLGSAALPPLVEEMRARHRDPEFASRAAMVMKGLGPRRLGPLTEYLPIIAEPLLLEVLVDVVACVEDKQLTYRLHGLLESLEPRAAAARIHDHPDPYARVRGKAHLALARLGSRVAVADLKRTLNDPSRRLDLDLLEAAAKIGTRTEIPDLLRAYAREDSWMRGRLREVFWKIVQREKIRKASGSFRSLTRQDREALRDILEDRRGARDSAPTLPGLRPRLRSTENPRRGRESLRVAGRGLAASSAVREE